MTSIGLQNILWQYKQQQKKKTNNNNNTNKEIKVITKQTNKMRENKIK